MSIRRFAPVLLALALGAVACSSGPSVTTTTSTSSPTAQPGAAASPGAFRRGLAGTVTSFDGSTLVLATRQGATVKVLTSGSTAVTKSVTATVGDIVPNDTVIVTGPQNPDGSYAATAIVDGTLGAGAGFGGNRAGTPSPRPSGAFGGGGFGGGGFGGGGGRRLGTAGTVAAINGATLTLTTAAGTTITVDTSSATVVTRTAQGALSDLAPNVAVTVTGPQNADGSYSATRITIGGPFGGGAAQPSQAAA